MLPPRVVCAAREQGATDMEIHDTVLIAAAFCMYNRYVDGLVTWQPAEESMYTEMGKHLASVGYKDAFHETGFAAARGSYR